MTRHSFIGFLVLASGCILTFAAACGTDPVLKPETSTPTAIEALDPTALLKVEGCGYQPLVTEGYAYCRVVEGPVGSMALTFIAPPQSAKCKTAPCVDFTLFYPDGSPAYQDSIPFGQTSKTVPWTTLVKKDTFSAADRGFWPYTYTIRWIGADGRSYKTVSEGELRLRVIRSQVCDPQGSQCKAYVPLRESVDSPDFAWTWQEGSQVIRMSTGARVYVSPATSVIPSPSPSTSQ
jgi:hypothetical protein